MTTIKDIKNECRAIIAQAEKATSGPWHYWNQPSNDLIATGAEKGLLICGLAGLKSMPNEFKFIAASRSFTPKAAKALLVTIDHIEREEGKGRMDSDDAQDKLNEICRTWEESK